MDKDKTKKQKPGPKPDSVKLSSDWQEAVKQALRKPPQKKR